MRLSTKCRYGTRAIIEIACNYGVRPTRRHEIEKDQGISKAYLENILLTLKNNGLIKAIRGSKGGFVLSSPPSNINLLQVVNALEGRLQLVECLESESFCLRTSKCATRLVWKRLQKAMYEILESITLRDLIEGQKR